MSLISAIKSGAQAVSRVKGIVLIVWVLSLTAAVIAVGPLATIIRGSLSHSVWAKNLVGSFDPSWLAETWLKSAGYPVEITRLAVYTAAVVAFVSHILVAGGAMSVFVGTDVARIDRGNTARKFFEGCGRYFWRFFRLFLLSLVFYGAILFVNLMLSQGIQTAWGGGMGETPVFYVTRFKLIVIAALVFLVGMLFDYAKIRLATGTSRSVLSAARYALGWIRNNFSRCLSLSLLMLAFSAILFLIYDRIAVWLPKDNLAGIVAMIVAQQLYVLGRIWTRLALWASEIELYQGATRRDTSPGEPVPFYLWPPQPNEAWGPTPAELLPGSSEEAAGPA